MGMFDYYYVVAPEFVCSEGHDLSQLEFQGKDLDCTLAQHQITGGCLTRNRGLVGGPPALEPFTGTLEIGAACPMCPALIQAITHNLLDIECSFDVSVVEDAVTSIVRTSPPTADQLAEIMASHWGTDAIGPMSHGEAVAYRVVNPGRSLTKDERAAWDARSRGG